MDPLPKRAEDEVIYRCPAFVMTEVQLQNQAEPKRNKQRGSNQWHPTCEWVRARWMTWHRFWECLDPRKGFVCFVPKRRRNEKNPSFNSKLDPPVRRLSNVIDSMEVSCAGTRWWFFQITFPWNFVKEKWKSKRKVSKAEQWLQAVITRVVLIGTLGCLLFFTVFYQFICTFISYYQRPRESQWPWWLMQLQSASLTSALKHPITLDPANVSTGTNKVVGRQWKRKKKKIHFAAGASEWQSVVASADESWYLKQRRVTPWWPGAPLDGWPPFGGGAPSRRRPWTNTSVPQVLISDWWTAGFSQLLA